MNILAFGPNSTKFCTHNLWATRRLERQKRRAEGECGGMVRFRVWNSGGGGVRVRGWDAGVGVQGARCGGGG